MSVHVSTGSKSLKARRETAREGAKEDVVNGVKTEKNEMKSKDVPHDDEKRGFSVKTDFTVKINSRWLINYKTTAHACTSRPN